QRVSLGWVSDRATLSRTACLHRWQGGSVRRYPVHALSRDGTGATRLARHPRRMADRPRPRRARRPARRRPARRPRLAGTLRRGGRTPLRPPL
ncbi:MAG: hypothetical protein AVDCRST_MAG18-4460, partial [uncultured Thermomicrobiales bacterium]